MHANEGEHFNRLDRPETNTRDRFAEFKDFQGKLAEYRNAYLALARRNPDSVKGLPSPDSDPSTFDPAQALEALRKVSTSLQAVPPGDLQT